METIYQGQGSDTLSKSRIHDIMDNGKNRLSDFSHTVSDKSKELIRVTDECVHTHSWKALGIMAGLGVLIGYFMHRR